MNNRILMTAILLIIPIVVLLLKSGSEPKQVNFMISDTFTDTDYEMLWQGMKDHYKLDGKTKVGQITVVSHVDKVERLRFELVSKERTGKYTHIDSRYCGECNDGSYVATTKTRLEEWAQYERMIGAETFFTTFEQLKGHLTGFGFKSFAVVSSGERELQGQQADYYGWNGSELSQLEGPLAEPAFNLTLQPNEYETPPSGESKRIIIYIG